MSDRSDQAVEHDPTDVDPEAIREIARLIAGWLRRRAAAEPDPVIRAKHDTFDPSS